jgi:hypothetical protein
MPMKRQHLNHDHVTDEHEINARVGSPALELTIDRGGKIARRARLQSPAHTSRCYNTEVEKNI